MANKSRVKHCPVCTCPMSIKRPTTCQNCDYQTSWSQDQIDTYQAKLSRDLTTHTETWYEVQYSLQGADDWFSTPNTADTIESAKVKLVVIKEGNRHNPTLFDFRVVRKVLTEEVVSK